MSLLLTLTNRALENPGEWVEHKKSGLKVARIRDHLIIYRRETQLLWLDLELRFIVQFNLTTKQEVAAINQLLAILELNETYTFVHSSIVYLKVGMNYYHKHNYKVHFGLESGNYGYNMPNR